MGCGSGGGKSVAASVRTELIGLLDFIGARIKHLVARPRPCLSIADLHHIQACGRNFSFPFKHAINTAAAAFLQVLYPRSGWVSWPIVALVGPGARVYRGPLRHRCYRWMDHWKLLWHRRRLVLAAMAAV